MINADSKDLQKLYLAYFGRPGDPSGINYWISCLNESFSINFLKRKVLQGGFGHPGPFDSKAKSIVLNL